MRNGRRFLVAALVAIAGVGVGAYVLYPRGPVAPWPDLRFEDVTAACGVRFAHRAGVTPEKLLPETMGAGVAVIDFDGDGRPDLFFVNGRDWPGRGVPGRRHYPALYRNNGDGTFADVTRDSGLEVELFGMGACVGDFDNDGRDDLFVTAVGGNRLFRNESTRDLARFRDVTRSAGVAGPGGPLDGPGDFAKRPDRLNWSASATFLDYDGDGLLDLFVTNYLDWSAVGDSSQGFKLATGENAYGPPRAFKGVHCLLYRNLGGGRFEDVSKGAGVEVSGPTGAVGKSLGVVATDIDGDGFPDVLVANDTERNFFFLNISGEGGSRRFREIGESSGVAFADRAARGAMGIDRALSYRPGRDAVVIANFAHEPNTLLVQRGPGELSFTDRAAPEGVALASTQPLKFAALFFDADLDGRLDLLSANGHLEPDISRALPDQSHAQSAQFFHQHDKRAPRFGLVPESVVGPDLYKPMVGRGAAYLDIDGDGSLDLVLTANDGPARVLRNRNRTGNRWLRVRLVGDGKRSNTTAIGATVTVKAGGLTQTREVCGARGYLSQPETALTFGLGRETSVESVTVRWPGRDAGTTALTDVGVDREIVVRQGE